MSSRTEEIEKRERVRQGHRDLLMEAIKNDDEKQADESHYILNNTDLNKWAFDELHYNKEYTDALRQDILTKTGEEYEGDIRDLIEDDFEHWNSVSNNLTHGVLNLGETVLTMSDEEKKNNLLRFSVYDDTDAFGEGSRDWWEQTKDVAGAILTDPITYTGLGNIPKIASKTAQSTLIKKLFAEGAGAPVATAIASGTLSGLNDLNTQAQRAVLGGEGINPVQTATATVVGSVSPAIGKYVGKAIGPAVRTVGAPLEAVKAGAGRVLSTKKIKTKMATQEAYDIGKSALVSKAKKEAQEQAERLKKGELFSPSDFSKTSQVAPKDMKAELATKLIKDKDYVNKLIRTPESVKSLQTYFPEQASSIKNIQKLMKGLESSKVDEKKLGENLIKNLFVDTATGVPFLSKVLSKVKQVFHPGDIMRHGTKQSWFINGLLNAYKNRGGRLNTIWGNHIKKTYNLSDAQLAEFQDYTYGLMANIPSQAFFRERHKDFKEKGNNFSY